MADAANMPFRFMDLAPELRNRIYRLAVLSETAIGIRKTGYSRPPLLQTSRQIRSEATGIYYSENIFIARNHAYDSDLFLSFTSMLPRMKGIQLKRAHQPYRGPNYHDVPNWPNLWTWLRRHHSREVLDGVPGPKEFLESKRNRATDHLVVSAMFETVRRLRKAPWEQVKSLLELQRPILAKLDWRWGTGEAA